MKFGSVCSGIEAASLAFDSVNIQPAWFSEIEEFPSAVLSHYYPTIDNHGDMNNLPDLIYKEKIEAPEILCGGTPCQAFSLAGWREGLIDERGQLTLKFIDIADNIDLIRKKNGQESSIIMWENVEGVLKDKTNAFGNFIAGLAGLDTPIVVKKWSNSGVLFGNTRNVAWRVLDSKYFGLPQQRKRLYVIATDSSINPELILFEKCNSKQFKQLKNINNLYNYQVANDYTLFDDFDENKTIQTINDHKIEVFRDYTDCLYSAYGTKWNGNAAAYNGSLYISQNDKVRRLTPLECERLMGFPDNYTNIHKAKDTSRYKAIGNSWTIPTIEWLAKQISSHKNLIQEEHWIDKINVYEETNEYKLYMFKKELLVLNQNIYINNSLSSNNIKKGNIFELIDTQPAQKLFISEKASQGILRRKKQKNINMNTSLEQLLLSNIKPSVELELLTGS